MMTTIAAIETTIPTTTATTIKITKKHHKIDISYKENSPQSNKIILSTYL